MKPEVGKYYRYDYTGHGTGDYIYDVFKVLEVEWNSNIKSWIVEQRCYVKEEETTWKVRYYFWNKYVKEISKKEILAEVL